jgi:hypothetical protein
VSQNTDALFSGNQNICLATLLSKKNFQSLMTTVISGPKFKAGTFQVQQNTNTPIMWHKNWHTVPGKPPPPPFTPHKKTGWWDNKDKSQQSKPN